MPHQPIPHQRIARFLTAIHAVIGALMPVIRTIERQPTRPWQHRANLSARFFAILRDLLTITARLGPTSLSPNPGIHRRTPSPLPSGQPQGAAHQPPRAPKPLNPLPAKPFTPRRLAQRLANLLRQLMALAAEAGAILPARLHHHAARAATMAGCQTLPPPGRNWERTG